MLPKSLYEVAILIKHTLICGKCSLLTKDLVYSLFITTRQEDVFYILYCSKYLPLKYFNLNNVNIKSYFQNGSTSYFQLQNCLSNFSRNESLLNYESLHRKKHNLA